MGFGRAAGWVWRASAAAIHGVDQVMTRSRASAPQAPRRSRLGAMGAGGVRGSTLKPSLRAEGEAAQGQHVRLWVASLRSQ